VNGSFQTKSPVDDSIYCERAIASDADVARAVNDAVLAQREWATAPLAERIRLCTAFVDALLLERDEAALELSWQMGRPRAQSPSELRGFEERARAMIGLAKAALEPIDPGEKPGFERAIERVPLGVVLTVAPWNYPYLTAVNSVVPALLAGNTVVLKHSAQTPLVAERFQRAFERAGAPRGVFQYLHASHEQVAAMIKSPGIDHVAFTGSVEAGRAVARAAAERFVSTGLELGGKDPAYVRHDVALDQAVENLVDGAFFNSGQSCCGIERIYVHESVYDGFVDGFVELTKQYRLGSPIDTDTNLGPVVRAEAAAWVLRQIAEAKAKGAKSLVEPSAFAAHREGTPYLAPQVLVDVDHTMSVMRDESFGPVVGIMKVSSDDEAVQLMNDSPFGLTASVWTRDVARARELGARVQTGTWFLNRCDYLDPYLAWTGVKDSGRGCTLSRVGFEALTRPKSIHLRVG
jgi:acyl-CoA reductase-like NAD-dependent aldehyde dehydrogenase